MSEEKKDQAEIISDLTREVVGQQNPELKAAFDALSDHDKIALERGHKVWKTNGKSEYVLVDNFPFIKKRGPGSNFTPKKKKRKK